MTRKSDHGAIRTSSAADRPELEVTNGNDNPKTSFNRTRMRVDPMIGNVLARRMSAVVLLFVAVMTVEAFASSGEAHAGASTPVCAPPNTPLAGVFLELYRLAVVSDSDEVWTETRSQLRLTGTLDSTLVVLESDDSTCAAALEVYRRHFRAGEGAQVLVAKMDTLRAIAPVDPVAESDTTSIQVGLTIDLITNADFSAVIDTIWS